MKANIKYDPLILIYPILFVLALWIVFWIEIRFHVDLKYLGIRPKELKGLRGVLFSPLLHGDLKHLLNNSLPLLLLSTALFYFYRGIAWKILGFGVLLTGILTWLIAAKGSTHIGASGVVYLLVSFLFFKGIWSKNYRLIALSLIVVFAYGGLVWGVLPLEPRVSWQGHLAGFTSGILLALIFYKYQIEFEDPQQKPKPYVSKREAEFLSHFDEEGNFIPASEQKDSKEKDDHQDNSLNNIKVVYIYKDFPKNDKKPE